MDKWTCNREDGRDLVREWLSAAADKRRAFVATAAELEALDTDQVDQVLGTTDLVLAYTFAQNL